METNSPRAVRPILNVVEGEALRLLECLLEPERRGFPRGVLKLETPSEVLLVAAKDRLSKAAGRFLFTGGIKEQDVLRYGRRTSGRFWDAHLNEGFVLRFTEATYQFWLGAARAFPLLSSVDGVGRQKRKLLRDVIPEVEWSTDTGDWIFFTLVYQGLEKFSLAAEPYAAAVRRLRLASPLLTLMVLERDASDPELLRSLRLLVRPSSVRLLECMEERFVSSWRTEVTRLYEMASTFDQVVARWEIVTRVLRTYLDVLDEAGRLDLSIPVLRLMIVLQQKVFTQGADAIRTRISSMSGVRNLQQRDTVVNAIAKFFSLGVWVYQRRDALAAQRYGDERYEEGQIFVRQVDALGQARTQIDTLTRSLSGMIG